MQKRKKPIPASTENHEELILQLLSKQVCTLFYCRWCVLACLANLAIGREYFPSLGILGLIPMTGEHYIV